MFDRKGLVSEFSEEDVEDFVKEVVEGPEIRGPVIMDESSLEGKQSWEDLLNLLETSNCDKRHEREEERYDCDNCYFDQTRKFVFQTFFLQNMLLEDDNKESQGGIEIDVFEVEQSGICEGGL